MLRVMPTEIVPGATTMEKSEDGEDVATVARVINTASTNTRRRSPANVRRTSTPPVSL